MNTFQIKKEAFRLYCKVNGKTADSEVSFHALNTAVYNGWCKLAQDTLHLRENLKQLEKDYHKIWVEFDALRG